MVCIGSSVNLLAEGGTSYLWSPGSGLSDSTVASPVASPTTTTPYTVIVSNACSSDTAYVTVTVNPTISINETPVTICNGDSVLIYGNNETVSGTYYDSLITISGCDSIYSTLLTVTTVDTSVIQSGDTLTANATGATYYWYDCNSNHIIVGQVWQSYIPNTSGSYAVYVTQNGCTALSSCHSFVVGIRENSLRNNIVLYPNPTTGKFTVASATAEIEVYDLFGRLVLRTNEAEIDMSSYSKGLYLLRMGDVSGRLMLE